MKLSEICVYDNPLTDCREIYHRGNIVGRTHRFDVSDLDSTPRFQPGDVLRGDLTNAVQIEIAKRLPGNPLQVGVRGQLFDRMACLAINRSDVLRAHGGLSMCVDEVRNQLVDDFHRSSRGSSCR